MIWFKNDEDLVIAHETAITTLKVQVLHAFFLYFSATLVPVETDYSNFVDAIENASRKALNLQRTRTY